MHKLNNRVAALEQAQPQGEKILFIILVGMGEKDMELTYIYDNYDNHWHRLPDETEDAFKSRAKSESPRNENRVAMLFGTLSHPTN